ncbi:MAG: septum formation initiator family protein [Bacteroidales bacterium]|jgi:cell division protein FtsB|nr:septum formation initiator family protein [Bacteroidales bacterium]
MLTRSDILEVIKPLFQNRITFFVLGFVIWMTFIDEDNIFVRINLHRKVSELQEEKAQLQNAIERDHRKMEELSSDRSQLEKFAREEYFMKKSDEVIFIVK